MMKKWKEFLAPSIIVGALFLIVLAARSLWPFGAQTIDYYDMAQWAEPFYYHNYDVLHGEKSLIFDWYTSLGRVIPGLNEPSLFDLLFYLVPRTHILEAMSLLMMIKIMAAAFTMNLFVRYINKDLPGVFRLMLAGGYGMCGFVLINYTVPQWLDMAVIVPLILMFSQIALKEGKFTGLAVSVFLIMIDDYYFTIQTLVIILLAGGAYFLIMRPAVKRSVNENGLYVSRFAAGIFLGLGLGAFSWISDINFILSSARFSNGSGDEGFLGMYLGMLENIKPAYLSRWFSLLGLSFPAALTASGFAVCIKKKDIRPVIFRLVCIFIVTAQLVLESIHLILHFGSYVNYPVRNGFMIYCVIAGIAAVSYDKREDAAGLGKTRSISIAVKTLVPIAAACGFAVIYRSVHGLTDHFILMISMLMMAVFAAVHLILMYIREGRISVNSVYLWIAELLIFGIIMIGKPLYETPYGNDPEQEGEFIRITDSLVSGFDGKLATGKDAGFQRMKNPDTTLNSNYGVVMKRETLSGWTNLALPEQLIGAAQLGYSTQFTRLLDSGGTIFSDMLLHITDVVSSVKVDEDLYEKYGETVAVTDHMTGSKRMYGLYRTRYSLPFAIPVKYAPGYTGGMAGYEVINTYADAIGYANPVASLHPQPEALNDNGHEIYTYHIAVSGKKALYFQGKCADREFRNTFISVDGEPVPVPTIGDPDNTGFPAHFNNNTLALGSFSDEKVTIKVDMDASDPDGRYEFWLYEIDLDALEELSGIQETATVTQGRSSIDISVKDHDESIDGYLLPVSYDSGWSAYSDGRKIPVTNVNGLFMFVPSSGENIHMSYFPPMMKTGIAVTVVSAAVFAALLFWDKKKKIEPSGVDAHLSKVCICLAALVFLAVYVVPMGFAAFYMIR